MLVKPGMIVGDIGANFGYYSLQFSRLVGENGFIFAFEPVNRYMIRLLEHLKLNNIMNVEVIDVALSNKIGEAQISVGECSGTFHWSSSNEPDDLQDVCVSTLDAFVKERNIKKLDFLKVDLDGHEPMFLDGAKNTIERFKPIMIIECSQESLFISGSSAWNLLDKLEELGYILISERTRKIFSNRLECLKEVGNFTNSANILCVPFGNHLLNQFKGSI